MNKPDYREPSTETDSTPSNLFEHKSLGGGESPLQEAFSVLWRFLPSPDQVRGFLFNLARKPLFWKVSGTVAALLVAWSYGPEWAAWAGEKARQGGAHAVEATAGLRETAGQALTRLPGAGVFSAKRAAYYIADDFEDLRVRGAHTTREESGLTLHPDTLSLEDYRVDFFARMDGQPVRWAVRAADPQNHYAFALLKKGKKYMLQRQTVVAGEVVSASDPLEVDAKLVLEGFNKITVVSHSNAVTTLLNSQGIDHLAHMERVAGAVGFYAESDRAAERFGEVIVRGNEDAWGRFLSEAHRLVVSL